MPYPPPPEFDKLALGEYSEPIEVETSEENRHAAVSLVLQARRSLDIVSRNLDPAVYDDAEFVDAVKQLALSSRRARVRILVQDPGTLARRGHRLVELAQRLTSSIELRTPAPEHDTFNGAILLVDEVGAIVRTYADRFEGTVTFNDRRTAGELRKTFDEMWKVAKSDPNLRRLHI